MPRRLCLSELLFLFTDLSWYYFGEKKVRSAEEDESIWVGFQEKALHHLAAQLSAPHGRSGIFYE